MGKASNGATPKTGQASVTGSAAIMVAAPTGATAPRASSGVVIKAPAANTQIVYIGGSDVTTANGYGLSAGDSVSLDIDDPSRVWAISASGTQALHFLYL